MVKIEQRLQEPKRFFFLALDDAFALGIPLLLALLSRQILLGGLAAFLIWQGWRRLKGEGGVERLLALLYWYLPTELTPYRGIPRSSVSIWRG